MKPTGVVRVQKLFESPIKSNDGITIIDWHNPDREKKSLAVLNVHHYENQTGDTTSPSVQDISVMDVDNCEKMVTRSISNANRCMKNISFMEHKLASLKVNTMRSSSAKENVAGPSYFGNGKENFPVDSTLGNPTNAVGSSDSEYKKLVNAPRKKNSTLVSKRLNGQSYKCKRSLSV